MKHKRIYFIRHGQSVDDEGKTFQSYDSGLSELGKKQIANSGRSLVSGNYDCLISSPMQRAKESAEILQASLNLEIQYADEFVESVRPSDIEGKPRSDETARAMQHQWKQTLRTTEDIRVGDGENYNDLIDRAKRALQSLHEKEADSIIVVTHGYFLRTMIASMIFGDSLTPLLLEKFQNYTQIDNGSVTIVDRVFYKDAYIWYVHSINGFTTPLSVESSTS
jgi:broad specificity phosphatase PhoE